MPTLLEMLVDVGSVKFGDFTLSSGKTSSYYVDIKRAVTEPDVLDAIARLMGRCCWKECRPSYVTSRRYHP